MASKRVITPYQILSRMALGVAVPTVPVLVWWKWAVDDRHTTAEEVRTRVRVPNVQTVDDLLVEKCQPGDVVLFDRRCEKCAAGPLAALSCVLGRSILCHDDPTQTRSVETGKFDHCGIVVPGFIKNKQDEYDPSNLLLLEATASGGIVARSLLTRLEMSQSRSVILFPLVSSGERRGDDDYEPSEQTKRLQSYKHKKLIEFRDKWLEQSRQQHYQTAHSTLGILGALGYGLGLHQTSRGPVSPSAWVVVSALQHAGIGENIHHRTAMESKTEDFLRDHRFHETDTVRLRPGWKFLPPVVMRELSRS